MVENDTLMAVGIAVAASAIVAFGSSLIGGSENRDTEAVAEQIARAVREDVDPDDTLQDPDEGDGMNGGSSADPDPGEAPDSNWTGGWSDLTGYSPYGLANRIGMANDNQGDDGDAFTGL